MSAAPQTSSRLPLWSVLRLRSTPASVAELAHAIGATEARIAWRLSRWTALGLLTAIKPRNSAANDQHPLPDQQQKRTRYIMADASRPLARPPVLDSAGKQTRARGGRAAMWRAMRILRRFDLVQLTLSAEVSEASAKQYVSCLLRAGILRRDGHGNAASGQRSVYSLAGRFGPQPPVVRQHQQDGRRVQEVFDPNTGSAREISACPPCAPLF